jgi:hypothetical protein
VGCASFARITSTTLPAFDDGRTAHQERRRVTIAQHHGGDRRPIADRITSSRFHHVERDGVTTAAGERAMGIALSGARKGRAGQQRKSGRNCRFYWRIRLILACHNLPWFQS